MRSFFSASALALGVALTLSCFTTARAQTDDWVPGQYMNQALVEVFDVAAGQIERSNFGFDDGAVCLVGVYLEVGADYTLTQELLRGEEYYFIAAGDEDATDVDFSVIDEDGDEVAADTRVDRVARVEYEPSDTGSYTLRIRHYEGEAAAFCCFAVLRKGGYEIPEENISTAHRDFINACAQVAQVVDLATEGDNSVGFLTDDNQAAMWGTVLRAEESAQIRNVSIGRNPTILLARGDTQAEDLDLHLLDDDEEVLSEDLRYDAMPIVTTEGSNRSRTIRVSNPAEDSGATFVLFGIVQVK